MGVVDPCVGVSGSTAPPTSCMIFDLSLPRPLPSLGLGVVTLARIWGLRRSVGFGVAAQRPVSSCGTTEEVAGDWWARFVAGNGHVRLEERTTNRVPVECISGFSRHTPSSCTN